MAKTAFLISPEAPAESAAHEKEQRRLTTQGLRIGMLDNGKGNADHLLKFILEGLKGLVPVASVTWLRKNSMSTPAPQAMLDQLVAETDLVVTAMGD